MLRVLTFSSLFPSSARPGHGIFVETRLRELLKTGAVDARVVAPVPWFPSQHPRWGSYAKMATTPHRERRNDLDVLHPRYLLAPKIGMLSAPWSLALAARPALQRLRQEGFDFDLIDAHYFYPDGVAAALLARWFKRPLMITARGSDLSFIPQYRLPRRWMQQAATQAGACVGVCNALVDVLREWGLPEHKLSVIPNGVDLQRFRRIPRGQARQQLGLPATAPLFLCVGNLVELKGHRFVIEALARLRRQYPDAELLLVGEGPLREELQRQALSLGLSGAVRFVGRVPNEQLYAWYSAANALVLASSREGWANVLLESMACGTPVIATRIWGTPEVVQPDSGGLLVDRSAGAIEAAMHQFLEAPSSTAQVRAYAERFGWEPSSQAQLALMRGLLAPASATESKKGSTGKRDA